MFFCGEEFEVRAGKICFVRAFFVNILDEAFFFTGLTSAIKEYSNSSPLSQVMYLEQLLACVDVLLRQCESDCGSVSLQLLQLLVTVQSLSTEPELSEKVRNQTKAYQGTVLDAGHPFCCSATTLTPLPSLYFISILLER